MCILVFYKRNGWNKTYEKSEKKNQHKIILRRGRRRVIHRVLLYRNGGEKDQHRQQQKVFLSRSLLLFSSHHVSYTFSLHLFVSPSRSHSFRWNGICVQQKRKKKWDRTFTNMGSLFDPFTDFSMELFFLPSFTGERAGHPASGRGPGSGSAPAARGTGPFPEERENQPPLLKDHFQHIIHSGKIKTIYVDSYSSFIL